MASKLLVIEKENVLVLLLLLVCLLPTSIRLFFSTTSDSTGLVVLSFGMLMAYACFRNGKSMSLAVSANIKPAFYCLVSFLIFHSTLSFMLNDNFDYQRFIFSVLILLPMLAAVIAFSNIIDLAQDADIDRAFKILFYFMLSVGYIGFSLFKKTTGAPKSLIFFSEPSHYALVFSPLFTYAYIKSKKTVRAVLLVFVVILGALIQNLTLFMVVAITLLLYTRLIFLPIVLALPVLAILFQIDYAALAYYLDRVSFLSGTEQTDNLTALSYLQGWQFMAGSLESYFPVGLGFQQLGSVDLNSAATLKLDIMGYDLNRNDGSFLASKIVSEFGLAGVAVILTYLYFFVKKHHFIWQYLNNKVQMEVSNKTLVYNVIYLCFSLVLFIRGSGYFTTTTFLFATAILGLTANPANHCLKRSLQCLPN